MSLQAGNPMYINHALQGDVVVFYTRDRYGNIASYNGNGRIQEGSNAPQTLVFQNGQAQIPRKAGYYTVTIDELAGQGIAYADATGDYIIRGIPKYATYITGEERSFNFYPDYNARYTVLAGGSFLREAEDILYHQIAGQSQSLAVSTLLSSPIQEFHLFTVFPHGGYRTGVSDTTIAEVGLSQTSDGYPVLQVSDAVQGNAIASVLYSMRQARLQVCALREACNPVDNSITLHMQTDSPQYAGIQNAAGIHLRYGDTTILQVDPSGKIQTLSQVILTPEQKWQGLYMHIEMAGEVIASLQYVMNATESVIVDETLSQTETSRPVIKTYGRE